MTAIERVRSQAELVAGRRAGSRTDFERFDPDEYKGANAKYAPTELFYKQVSGEVSVPPKDLAEKLIRLVDDVTGTVETVMSLLNAIPDDSPAAKVLIPAIRLNLKSLVEKPE